MHHGITQVPGGRGLLPNLVAVDFYVNEVYIGSDATDADGVATLKPPAGYKGDSFTFRAVFEGDLAYLHVHPADGGHGGGHAGDGIRFETEFPSAARYALFLQFKHEGRVHTVAFTQTVS